MQQEQEQAAAALWRTKHLPGVTGAEKYIYTMNLEFKEENKKTIFE